MSDISIEFGEMFYQLRAALDACVYESACLETGQTPPPDEAKLAGGPHLLALSTNWVPHVSLLRHGFLKLHGSSRGGPLHLTLDG
jgi:hypothetical protein